MSVLGISPIQLVGGLLIFVRILAVFATSPIFGHLHLPPQIKIGLAMVVAVLLAPIIALPDARSMDNLLYFAAAVAKEVVVGLTIGYVSTLIFLAIQLAGEVVDMQIGFGLANLADPLLGTQASLVGQFQYMLSTLFFLAVNGHHLILTAAVKSFELVPLGALSMQPLLATKLLDILAQLFLLGLRIGGPVMLAVFLTDLALGLLGRTVPQMNLMQVGFPVKIFVGLAMLLVSLPFFITISGNLFASMYHDVLTVLHTL